MASASSAHPTRYLRFEWPQYATCAPLALPGSGSASSRSYSHCHHSPTLGLRLSSRSDSTHARRRRQVPRPFTERTAGRRLQVMPGHVVPGQVHARRVGRLQHEDSAACAGDFDITPAHHHFTCVQHQARRARKVPDRFLTRPGRCGKGRPRLAVPVPVFARRADPVGELGHQSVTREWGRVVALGSSFVQRVMGALLYYALVMDAAALRPHCARPRPGRAKPMNLLR
jgi:hypothetical protein